MPIRDVNIDNTVISEEFRCTKQRSRYFNIDQNNEKFTHVCFLLPKMSGYLKNFDNAKTMCFWLKMKNY